MAGAAGYSSSLIRDTENDNQKVLDLIWKSGLQSWWKRFLLYKIKVRNGVYPAHLESLWIIFAVVGAIHYSGSNLPYDLVNKFIHRMPR